MPTDLEGALSYYNENDPRGEYVLILQGKTFEEIRKEEQAGWETMTVEDHMEHYLNQGIDKKDAMKLVAKDRGVSKRDIYKLLECND